MPALAGPQDELGVLEAGDQLLARRRLHRLPDLAWRLALEAGEVAERHRAPSGPRRLGEVRAERGVELEDVRVASCMTQTAVNVFVIEPIR